MLFAKYLSIIFFPDGRATEINNEGYCLWGRYRNDDNDSMTWHTWRFDWMAQRHSPANYSFLLQDQDPEFNKKQCFQKSQTSKSSPWLSLYQSLHCSFSHLFSTTGTEKLQNHIWCTIVQPVLVQIQLWQLMKSQFKTGIVFSIITFSAVYIVRCFSL